MAAAPLVGNLPNFFMQWPDDAALILIRRRRVYQGLFATSRICDQRVYWRQISRFIRNLHAGVNVTSTQCHTKWNALKSGYENLLRLDNRNPEGYRTHIPTMHDELFYAELSDEFWLVERK